VRSQLISNSPTLQSVVRIRKHAISGASRFKIQDSRFNIRVSTSLKSFSESPIMREELSVKTEPPGFSSTPPGSCHSLKGPGKRSLRCQESGTNPFLDWKGLGLPRVRTDTPSIKISIVEPSRQMHVNVSHWPKGRLFTGLNIPNIPKAPSSRLQMNVG